MYRRTRTIYRLNRNSIVKRHRGNTWPEDFVIDRYSYSYNGGNFRLDRPYEMREIGRSSRHPGGSLGRMGAFCRGDRQLGYSQIDLRDELIDPYQGGGGLLTGDRLGGAHMGGLRGRGDMNYM